MSTPQFIVDIRKHIGNDLLWLHGVGVVIRHDDQVLLARRADTGVWAMVGGIVDPGEPAAVAAVREVAEEVGISVVLEHLIAVTVSPLIVYANGNKTLYQDLVFTAHLAEGVTPEDVHLSDDENTDVGWFRRDNLPEPLAKSTAQRFDLLDRFEAQGTAAALFD
ncbi:MAG: NUDIX domain-containing protein [Cellulomonadaceae bacterium]|jgi:8-oxo-dGTP pyrophosphatase MutT (NUDIX family)|nr:NUDIX domain-containing protein [Cellulomonadaceae bacterium]